MEKKEALAYLNAGREIEFLYKGDKYSITYGTLDGRDVISFCKFYGETTEVDTAEELLTLTRDGITVEEMLESLPLKDTWIY